MHPTRFPSAMYITNVQTNSATASIASAELSGMPTDADNKENNIIMDMNPIGQAKKTIPNVLTSLLYPFLILNPIIIINNIVANANNRENVFSTSMESEMHEANA